MRAHAARSASLRESRAYRVISRRDIPVRLSCVECQAVHARKTGGSIARPMKETRLQIVRDLIENRGGVLLSTEYVSARSKLKVRCGQGHEFDAAADNLKRKRWCPGM